jgi:hypothetical protein
MEREGQLPEGSQLLRPNPSFCFKIKSNPKIFVNVCHNKLIESLKQTPTQQGGKVRQAVSIPYSLSNVRSVSDHAGAKCKVYDIVFNDKVKRRGRGSGRGRGTSEGQSFLYDVAVFLFFLCHALCTINTPFLQHFTVTITFTIIIIIIIIITIVNIIAAIT